MLGVCYGMQLIAHLDGGDVIAPADSREYGRAEVQVCAERRAALRRVRHWTSRSSRG